jgi:hypothetical protein
MMVTGNISLVPFIVYAIALKGRTNILYAFTTTRATWKDDNFELRSSNRQINRRSKSLQQQQSEQHESSKDSKQNKATGYRFGDISRSLAQRINDKAIELTGKDKYEFGDISRWIDGRAKERISNIKSQSGDYKYEFGDISRLVDDLVKDQAAKYTGKDKATDYQFGDISKTILKKVLTGEYDPQDVYLALRIVVVAGCTLLPLAQMLPLNTLFEMFELGLVRDIGFRILPVMASSIDARMKEALTGNSQYQLGDIAKERLRQNLAQFTGKDIYEFGDITRAIIQRQDSGKRSSGFPYEDGSLAIDDPTICDELAAWDRSYLENNRNSTVTGLYSSMIRENGIS